MSDLNPPPDGDVDKGLMLKAITWSECGVALALVLARIFTRTRLIKQWGWDDAFICLAVVRGNLSIGIYCSVYFLISYFLFTETWK